MSIFSDKVLDGDVVSTFLTCLAAAGMIAYFIWENKTVFDVLSGFGLSAVSVWICSTKSFFDATGNFYLLLVLCVISFALAPIVRILLIELIVFGSYILPSGKSKRYSGR